MPAALAVEQAAERAARVEARQAAPVDRAGAGDQRGAVAVADQRVVGDRRVRAGVGHGGLIPRYAGRSATAAAAADPTSFARARPARGADLHVCRNLTSGSGK